MTETPTNMIPCPVCKGPMELRPTKGRKSGKPGLMWICPKDGRHFRGFIEDREYVDRVLDLLEGQDPGSGSEEDE